MSVQVVKMSKITPPPLSLPAPLLLVVVLASRLRAAALAAALPRVELARAAPGGRVVMR